MFLCSRLRRLSKKSEMTEMTETTETTGRDQGKRQSSQLSQWSHALSLSHEKTPIATGHAPSPTPGCSPPRKPGKARKGG